MKRFYYEFMEALSIAYDALWANRLRGVLTTLGILIGIAAVISTMTIANGLSNRFQESISAVGSDVLYVSREPWVFNGNWFEIQKRPQLDYREARKLELAIGGGIAVNPTTTTRRSVKYRSQNLEEISIIGTTEKQMLVSTAAPEAGRFLTPFDLQFKKDVCVIGKGISDLLFAGGNPINKEIRIGRSSFRVVGVMEEQGSASFFGGPNFDRQIFIPVTTLLKNFGSANRSFNFAVKVPSQQLMSEYEYQVIGEMRKIRKLEPAETENFSVNQMTTLVNAYNQIMGVLLIVGLVITGIALFVGGMGVMNIMFVSVTERTREIGLRKAVGARKRAILIQFMLESAVICLLGGALGLLVASGFTLAVNAMMMPASISPGIVFVAILTSIGVGMAAGIVPAVRAARLHPIEALRYE